MKEILFIRQNVQQWQSIENIAEDPSAYSPDDVAGAYLRVTTDLAFAQTHYPTSRITLYLNDLASVLHNSLYRRRHERHSRIITFWTQEVPLTMWEARHLLLASFIIMVLSVLVGLMKLLSVVQDGVPVVGDLLPAVAGLVGGFCVLLQFYMETNSIDYAPNGLIQKLFVDSRRTIGICCLVVATLHFVFPRAIFL